jgi:hypothetical protein
MARLRHNVYKYIRMRVFSDSGGVAFRGCGIALGTSSPPAHFAALGGGKDRFGNSSHLFPLSFHGFKDKRDYRVDSSRASLSFFTVFGVYAIPFRFNVGCCPADMYAIPYRIGSLFACRSAFVPVLGSLLCDT